MLHNAGVYSLIHGGIKFCKCYAAAALMLVRIAALVLMRALQRCCPKKCSTSVTAPAPMQAFLMQHS